jgi:hypothetical protein
MKREAPRLELPTADGKRFSLAAGRGKPQWISFLSHAA